MAGGHAQARGGRSREENPEKNDLQAARITPEVGCTIPSVLESRLGLSAGPQGVLGLLLPGDG